jgi:hypothetical protein
MTFGHASVSTQMLGAVTHFPQVSMDATVPGRSSICMGLRSIPAWLARIETKLAPWSRQPLVVKPNYRFQKQQREL